MAQSTVVTCTLLLDVAWDTAVHTAACGLSSLVLYSAPSGFTPQGFQYNLKLAAGLSRVTNCVNMATNGAKTPSMCKGHMYRPLFYQFRKNPKQSLKLTFGLIRPKPKVYKVFRPNISIGKWLGLLMFLYNLVKQ